MVGGAAGGFVVRAFESMLKECGNRKYSALQSAIQTYLDSGKDTNQQPKTGETTQVLSAASNQSSSESESGPGKVEIQSDPSGGAEGELVLNPLRLAFETKNIKVVELALDCLHKLIEYNHLEGDPGLEGGKNSKLLTDILNMVCSCVDNSSPDSTTLQVLKVLLTSIASTKLRVHGEPLLGVIRVCCNISLNSKSPISQATSKAMLTQMLSIIFRQMETDVVSSNSVEPKEAHSEDGSNSVIEEASSRDRNGPRITLEDVLYVKQIHNTSLVSLQGIQNLVVGSDIKGLEAVLQKAVDLEDSGKVGSGIGSEGISVEQRDALLLFHTLCKMGVKDGKDELTNKTRILSLELLHGLLEDVGDSFTKNFQFIDSIRAHLSYALLRGSVSQSHILFQYATGIFSVLLLRFRESLKAEMGALFPVFVQRSLDGTDLNQKLSVLRMLEKASKDPQMLVDLYVNYDCDLDAPNLFERMVSTLSKVAQGTENMDTKSSNVSQTGSLKTSSLQGLVNVLKSLVTWEKSHRESEKQNKENVSSEEVPPRELDESKSTEEDSPSNLAVMHAYVESMNFCGMKFDIAIREFLKGFRLPREAQKIDRIMEKFAERYCTDNPGLFKNADTAYVLAYAILTLNYDAHNPKVSPKLSKSEFINMNVRNNAEESASQDLLEEIYDSVVKEEIKMKNDPTEVEERDDIINVLNLGLPRRSSSTDSNSEDKAIIKHIQSLINSQGEKKGAFYTSDRIELVCPMVEAVGWPLLAIFAVTMGDVDNQARISLCMEGFKEGIHITHVLGLDTIRYAFLTSLVRYNYLHAPKDMRGKNVEALRTLLDLCDTEIYALRDSWVAILECISRLEYTVSWPAMTATVMQGSNQISRDAILQSLRELSGKPTEQVFVNSVKLPSESVLEFFTALCNVSAEELKQTPPRTFSLQKVVEISYYNMARIHLVWARIWSVLANHFIVAGSHADEKVAMCAIDSVRQLGMKYLEHAELTNFTFQNEILRPFVILMQSSTSESIRRLILDSTVQMIKSKVGNIKSGWRSIFMIFSMAADDDLERIVESAFENVEQAILEHFNQVVGDCFMDCVNCLIGFANNKSSHSISLKAIVLIRICADRLAEGLVPDGSLKPLDIKAGETFHLTEQYLFPMLAGLSELTSDQRSEVRNCALEVLFDLLNERGRKFSSSFWEYIFQRTLFPIFDQVRHAGKDSFISSGDEWLRESSVHALQLLCNLFNTFYKDVCFMLSPLLSLLLDCAKKTDQSVVSISLGALVHLIEVGGHQFSDHDWDTLLQSIRDASYTTQPFELLNDLGLENRNHRAFSRDLDSPSPLGIPSVKTSADANGPDHSRETARLADTEGSEGTPSPSNRTTKPNDGGGLQRSQTLGQKIMGNMKDNLFVRTFTSKNKSLPSDVLMSFSPSKFPDAIPEADARDEVDSPALGSIRSKCITQLLLIGAIDGIQKKYWDKLNTQQKITMMEISFSVLEFASSYNSYSNLRLRMHQIPAERLPLNLLRQELSGTCVYLDILHKTTAEVNIHKEEAVKEDKLERVAEEKLVSFCERVLREASEFQSNMEETTSMDIHRVLELRSPIIVKVLRGMCKMNSQIFKNRLRDLYPSITKLVCCDQIEIRGALADLLTMQLSALLP
ncbi:hypothetical protein ABFS83_06G199500 [Erythranthe nasuta]